MARIEVGFVTAAAVFVADMPEERQRDGMRKFVSSDVEGSLAQDYIASFVSEFDFALQRLLRQWEPMVRTLRADDGYAWPEHHKGWLRFGCNLVVDDDERDAAVELLSDPEFAGSYDALLDAAARGFVEGQLAPELFEAISVTFHVAAQPGDA